jgi:hypothetical protein
VTALHRVSDSHAGIAEMLSSATVQDAAAVTAHCRTSRGADRSGAGDGSISETRNRAAVDLAVPCSPVSARIGCGISGTSAATSQPTISPNPASTTLSSLRSWSSSRPAPGWGTGSGWVRAVRRNSTGEISASAHPSAVTITARPVGSARSSTIRPRCLATRSATGTGRESPAIPSITARASTSEDADGAVPVRA